MESNGSAICHDAQLTRRLFSAGAATFLATLGLATVSGANPQERVIAISFPNSSTVGAVIASLDQAKAYGKELGFKVIIDDPGSDLNKQINTLKTWIEQKVDVIVCVVLQPQVFVSIAKQARDAGIEWITYGATIANESAMVGYELYEDGRRLGEYAGKWVTENLGGVAKVAFLGYEKGSWGQLRGNGIKDGLRASAPNVEIVAEQDAITPTEGLNAVRTILQAHPEVNVILGVEDPATEGAYKAWVAAGKDPKDPNAFIGGMDGTPPALKLLREGGTIYRASMAIPLREVGNAIVETADRLLKGEATGDTIIPLVLVTEKSPEAQRFLIDQGVTD